MGSKPNGLKELLAAQPLCEGMMERGVESWSEGAESHNHLGYVASGEGHHER